MSSGNLYPAVEVAAILFGNLWSVSSHYLLSRLLKLSQFEVLNCQKWQNFTRRAHKFQKSLNETTNIPLVFGNNILIKNVFFSW